jgi:hypothetical protein
MAILAVGFSQVSGPLFQFLRVSDVAISMIFLGLSALQAFCRADYFSFLLLVDFGCQYLQ